MIVPWTKREKEEKDGVVRKKTRGGDVLYTVYVNESIMKNFEIIQKLKSKKWDVTHSPNSHTFQRGLENW